LAVDKRSLVDRLARVCALLCALTQARRVSLDLGCPHGCNQINRAGGGSERKRDKKVTHNAVKLAPFAAGRVEAGSARGTERLTLPRVSGAGDGGYDDERDA